MKFRQRIRVAIYRSAIHIALRRPAPDEIPPSGKNRLRVRNYFSTYFGGQDDQRQFIVKDINKHGVIGKCINKNYNDSFLMCVPNIYFSYYKMMIHHYFGEMEIHYTSGIEFVIKKYMCYPYVILMKERLSKFLYDRKKLYRRDRIKLLLILVRRRLEDRNFQINSVSLMGMLYGERWVTHPDNKTSHQYYVLLLDSLVSSGDLEQANGLYASNSYQVTPQALSTLARHEEEDRRHRDQVRQQKILAFLTFAIVIVGMIQVFLGWEK